MSELSYILLFTFLGSVGSLIGGLILISHEKIALKISHFLAAFAAGTLLGTAFFDLLPEAAHEAEGTEVNIFFWALMGLLAFFFIERFIHWFHHHEEQHEHEKEIKSTVPLIIISDTVHNFIDGVVIAATFMVSIPLGIVTALAVIAHELPQEIGDFGLLLHKKMKKGKIILVNILSALFALLGAVLTYAAGNILEPYIPVFLAITAGFFIYIASSDLIPEIHYERRKGYAIIESSLLILGVIAVWISTSFLGHST